MHNPANLAIDHATWLADTMARNRARFGGWSMELTDPPADPPPSDPVNPVDQPGDPDLGDAGKRAIKAERERASTAEKALADATARLKEFEDAQKSEAEKAAERAAALERTATESAAKALRYEAAAKAGISLDLAMRLQGSTPEELEADATALKGLLGTTPGAPAPRPDPSQGGGGTPPAPKNLNDAIGAHYGA